MAEGGGVGAIDFRSDNTASVSPEIMDALLRVNRGTAPSYGTDALSRDLDRAFGRLFETEVRVFPVATGTAANALSLCVTTPPYGAIYCHKTAHIHTSEGNATEFYSGGAKLLLLDGPDFKISPSALAEALAEAGFGQTHKSQPAALSLTQATDRGTVYAIDEVRALTAIAERHRLKVHMDGARLANALVRLGASPADATWRAGVDILSFGATKNGAMNAEAIVVFDPALAGDLAFRLRRSGQVWSKMRFAAAQLHAYVADGLWLRSAARANALAGRMAAGIARISGCALANPVEANEVFAVVPAPALDRLAEAGVLFARRAATMARFVCRFDSSEDEVDRLLDALAKATVAA